MSLHLHHFRSPRKESIFDIYKKKLYSKSYSCKNILNNHSISKDNSSFFIFANKTSLPKNPTKKANTFKRNNSTITPIQNIIASQLMSKDIKRKLSQMLIETLSLSHEAYPPNPKRKHNNDHRHNHGNLSISCNLDNPKAHSIENKKKEIMKLLSQDSSRLPYKNNNERMKMILQSNKALKKYMTIQKPPKAPMKRYTQAENNMMKSTHDFKCSLVQSMNMRNNCNDRYGYGEMMGSNVNEEQKTCHDCSGMKMMGNDVETPKKVKAFNYEQCYSYKQQNCHQHSNEELPKGYNTEKIHRDAMNDEARKDNEKGKEKDMAVRTLNYNEAGKEDIKDVFTFREEERMEKERIANINQAKKNSSNDAKCDSFEELKKTLYFREFYCDD